MNHAFLFRSLYESVECVFGSEKLTKFPKYGVEIQSELAQFL